MLGVLNGCRGTFKLTLFLDLNHTQLTKLKVVDREIKSSIDRPEEYNTWTVFFVT